MFLIPGSTALMLMPTAPEEQLAVFRDTFAGTWVRIPEADRVSIIGYWAQGGQRVVGVYLDRRAFPNPNVVAKAPVRGTQLHFNPDRIFNLAETDWLELVIAHELAHVWLYATNDSSHAGQAPAAREDLLAW